MTSTTEFLKGLPLVGVTAFALSVSFATGFFYWAGLHWLAILSLQQLFSITWISLPTSFLSLGIGQTFAGFKILKYGHAGWNLKEMPLGRKAGIITSAAIGTLSLIFISLEPVFGPNLAAIAPAAALMFVIMWDTTNEVFSRSKEDYEFSKIPEIVFSICVLCYSYGLAEGAKVAQSTPSDVLILKDRRTLCGSILLAGTDLVIYREGNQNQYNAVKWDNIESISRNAGCHRIIRSIPVKLHTLS